MVKHTNKNNKDVWVCRICGFAYKEKGLAQKCEDFCNRHHQCSLEITKHSVK